jgi:hypothetical protein
MAQFKPMANQMISGCKTTRSAISSLSLLALACLSSCADSNKIAAMDASQQRPEWAVQLQSTCNDVAVDDCPAGFPYSVGADGNYRVGPGPQGQVLTGKLSSEEFAELQKLYLESVGSARAHRGDEICVASAVDASQPNASATDTVSTIAQSGEQTDWIHTGERGVCSKMETPELAQKLLAYMRSSAAKHYPLPFPDDACDQARASLETLYGNVRACTNDADCSFIDEAFQPVAQDYLTFLIQGDCSGAQPLVVANRSQVETKRTLLLQSFSHAQEQCKRRAASSCAGFSNFQPTRPAPICGGGICRARSG